MPPYCIPVPSDPGVQAAQQPGIRALRTRQRILDATASLLGEVRYRELTTTAVTQRVELSPPAFYRYFSEINEAVLEMTAGMRASAGALAKLVRTSRWDSDAALSAPLTSWAWSSDRVRGRRRSG